MLEGINPSDLLALFKNPAFLLCLIWLIKEIWAGSTKLADKINALTISIARLEVKIESLKSDIDFAHSKIRDLNVSAK